MAETLEISVFQSIYVLVPLPTKAYVEEEASTMMKTPPIDTTQTPPVEDMDTPNGKWKSETQETEKQYKKQFTGHGCRCTKKQLRIDFATTNTKKHISYGTKS